MTIDEIIAKEQEISNIFQRTVDTHMTSGNFSLEELYCDDTEMIEEELQRCKELANFHKQIANIMQKYQKIKEQVDIAIDIDHFETSEGRLMQIREIINGNDD